MNIAAEGSYKQYTNRNKAKTKFGNSFLISGNTRFSSNLKQKSQKRNEILSSCKATVILNIDHILVLLGNVSLAVDFTNVQVTCNFS